MLSWHRPAGALRSPMWDQLDVFSAFVVFPLSSARIRTCEHVGRDAYQCAAFTGLSAHHSRLPTIRGYHLSPTFPHARTTSGPAASPRGRTQYLRTTPAGTDSDGKISSTRARCAHGPSAFRRRACPARSHAREFRATRSAHTNRGLPPIERRDQMCIMCLCCSKPHLTRGDGRAIYKLRRRARGSSVLNRTHHIGLSFHNLYSCR
jgi:hypothetical protein